MTTSRIGTGAATLSDARAVLRARFGHDEFRAGQASVVRAMLADRDVLAVMPTGAGKSICYQVPALLAERPTLVVSPLIALMEDQVGALRARGVPAFALTSATSPAGRRTVRKRLESPGPLLLYAAPERLTLSGFRAVVARSRPARIVVDEAHCISQWGHDFRPAYLAIGRFARAVGRPPVAAFTATATPATREDICDRLDLRRVTRFLSSVDRPNLWWEVEEVRQARRGLDIIGRAVRDRGDGAALVYVTTRALAAGVAAALRRLGQPAIAYHAGLTPARRAAAQDAFLADRRSVVVATCAFGMGIDHPNVRLVAHLGMPGALEAYVQEAGRAGRDGAAGRCLLVALPSDRALHLRRIGELARPGRRAARGRLRAMRGYVRERRCRRKAIAVYFGERPPACAGCDLCRGAFPGVCAPAAVVP